MESQLANEEQWSRFLNRWDGEGTRPLGDAGHFEPRDGYQQQLPAHDPPPPEAYSARVRRTNAERELAQPTQYFQDRYQNPAPDRYGYYYPERAKQWHPAAGAQPRLPGKPKPRRVSSEYLDLERPGYDRARQFDTEFDNNAPYKQQRLTRGLLLDYLDSYTPRPVGGTQRGYTDRSEQPGGPSGRAHPQARSSVDWHHWPGQFVHGDQGPASPPLPYSPYGVARGAGKGESGLLPLPHSGFDSRSDVNAMRERGPMRDTSRSGPSLDSRIDSRGKPVTREGSSDPSSSPGGHETNAQHDSQQPAKHLRNQASPGGQPHQKAQRKTGDGSHGLAAGCDDNSHGMVVGNPICSGQQGSNTAFEPYRKSSRPVHAAGSARNPQISLGAKKLPEQQAFGGQQSPEDDSSGSKKQGTLQQRQQHGIAMQDQAADHSKPSSKSSGERCSTPSDEQINQCNHSGSNSGSNEPPHQEAPEVTLSKSDPRQGVQAKPRAALKLMIGTDPLVRSKRAGRRAAKAIAALQDAAVNPRPIDRMTQEDTRQHVRKAINLAVAAGKFALQEMHQMTGTLDPDGANDDDDDDDDAGEDDAAERDE